MRVFAFLMGFVGVAFAEAALAPPQGYPESTNWWRAEPSCHQGHIDKPNINAFVLGGHCDIALMQKTVSGIGRNFADWINDGQVGIPVAADDVMVAIAGTNGPDVVYLYGIKSDGTVVVAFPVREYADGSRTARYADNNNIIVSSTDTGGRRYCWTGSDWFQGLDSTSCDTTHHARLVALRAQGEGLQVVRQEYFGQ